jgi:hypothetical protein
VDAKAVILARKILKETRVTDISRGIASRTSLCPVERKTAPAQPWLAFGQTLPDGRGSLRRSFSNTI